MDKKTMEAEIQEVNKQMDKKKIVLTKQALIQQMNNLMTQASNYLAEHNRILGEIRCLEKLVEVAELPEK